MTKHLRAAENNSNNLHETNAQYSATLHLEQNNNRVATIQDIMDNLTEDNITNGSSFDLLMEMFDDGTENKTTLDDAWLTARGFVRNKAKDERCYICHQKVDEGIMIYNILCCNEVRHPLHTECAQLHIKHKGTTCPGCRCVWE